MKKLLVALLFLYASTINAQDKSKEKADSYNMHHGVVIEKFDKSLKDSILVIQIGKSSGIIFPAAYASQKFKSHMLTEADKKRLSVASENSKYVRPTSYDTRKYFTPNSSLIKLADSLLVSQYCQAHRRFQERTWAETLDYLKEEAQLKKELKQYQKQVRSEQKNFNKWCSKWQQELVHYDRQYVGFINAEGEKVVWIQLLDFRDDPYNLKPLFSTTWINGWHGWFETNTRRLHVHVEKEKITINEDL